MRQSLLKFLDAAKSSETTLNAKTCSPLCSSMSKSDQLANADSLNSLTYGSLPNTSNVLVWNLSEEDD